ncbi:MAG: PD-(D/E)XK nuclease family protein [Paracoccaceae bacterium]
MLYVAMTRAEAWLIVAAAGDVGEGDDSWYRKIEAAMRAQGALDTGFAQGDGLRLEQGDWAGLETVESPEAEAISATLPDWALRRAPVPDPRPKPLSPSELPGAKALPGEAGQDEAAAKTWGRQVHLLLEVLPMHPAGEWEGVAARLLAEGPDAAGGETLARCLAEARGVLEAPELRPLFQAEALAEVPVTASLPQLGGRRIHGVIDRLIVSEAEVLVVDFKTNAVVPESPQACPDGLLRQMGAYTAALEQVFPGKSVVPALLWTRTATLMRLPHDLVMQALQDSHMLDAPPPGT